MSEDMVLSIGAQAIKTAILLAGPLLVVALITGIAVSIFQAVTQINEATLTFIPKMMGVVLVLVVAAPWMLKILQEYAILVYGNLSDWIQ